MRKLQNKNNINYLKISQSIFYCGLFLLSFIFFNILIASTLFIFKISIQFFYPLLSLVLSGVLIGFLMKKNKLIDFKSLYPYIALLLPIILIIFTTHINGKIYDYTWDGNSYHKATIGMMMEGWNPLYEYMEDFDASDSTEIYVKSSSYLWGNHYAKASHIFAACIGSLTGNVESGKCLNILSIISLFCFVFSFLLNKKEKIMFPFLFSCCLITCTTIGSQFLTNYVDLLVYLYLFMIIYSFFLFEYGNMFENKLESFLVYFMSLIIMVNIKFSAFGYAGLFCLGYYLWYIYRIFKKKIDISFFKKFTIISFIAVLISVFVVGLSVYPKNLLEKGHPFYPLMGENKVDIMTANQPAYFVDKSSIEKFAIATFSKVDNISAASGLEATYKIPFSISKSEIAVLSNCDVRISGNGIFFSGILIISSVVLLVALFKLFKSDKKLFAMFVIPLIITILMIIFLEESWWARYFPQLHFFIFFALLLLDKSKNKFIRTLMYALVIIILINNLSVLYLSTRNVYDYTKISNEQFKTFEELTESDTCKLELYSQMFHGAIYNAELKTKEYETSYLDTINEEDLGYYGPFMNGFVLWRCKE